MTGAHFLLYSTDAEADRAFLRDVLGFPSIDAHPDGTGWLIFKLPPAELAVHPGGAPGGELYLLVDDIVSAVDQLTELKAPVTEIQDQGWGLVVHVTLPSGAPLGLYQARHRLAVDLPD
jgi:catechol 2,3-dioxygenase-like lactoylglutathione lyase family enzyme